MKPTVRRSVMGFWLVSPDRKYFDTWKQAIAWAIGDPVPPSPVKHSLSWFYGGPE